MSFQVNDLVYITPTGDPDIDAFVGQQMTITEINHVLLESVVSPTSGATYNTYFDQYELVNAAGESATVIDGEMEHCGNGDIRILCD